MITQNQNTAEYLLRIIKEKMNRGEDPALADEFFSWRPIDYVSQLVQISNSNRRSFFSPKPIVIQFNDLNSRLLIGKILIAEIQYSILVADELINHLGEERYYLKNIDHIAELNYLKKEFSRKAVFHIRRLEETRIASVIDAAIYQTILSDYRFSIESLMLIKNMIGIENEIYIRSPKPLFIIKNGKGVFVPYHPKIKELLKRQKLPKI
ncbi:MAG: hypothetical protein Q7S73_00815 [bacterium]|nr:hypothetical protein [bacterium]